MPNFGKALSNNPEQPNRLVMQELQPADYGVTGRSVVAYHQHHWPLDIVSMLPVQI